MKIKKQQIVYIPTKEYTTLNVVEEGRVMDKVVEEEMFIFTPEQLNEYITNIIKQSLEIVVEKVELNYSEDEGQSTEIDSNSILNTFEEIYNQFKI